MSPRPTKANSVHNGLQTMSLYESNFIPAYSFQNPQCIETCRKGSCCNDDGHKEDSVSVSLFLAPPALTACYFVCVNTWQDHTLITPQEGYVCLSLTKHTVISHHQRHLPSVDTLGKRINNMRAFYTRGLHDNDLYISIARKWLCGLDFHVGHIHLQ